MVDQRFGYFWEVGFIVVYYRFAFFKEIKENKFQVVDQVIVFVKDIEVDQQVFLEFRVLLISKGVLRVWDRI